jgi:prepilin-type N-terminal cleavage/methylation domain-containing protein
MRPNPRPGFTLIELLTVVAIIGVLAAVLIPAALGVQTRAKVANSQTALSGWASGLVRYKQAYGFYPNLAAGTYPTADTCFKLEDGTGANNLGARLIMCLAGRNPNGSNLTAGGTGNRLRWNRNAETFVEFSREDYEDFTKLPAATDTTGTIGNANYLVDRLGNRNIRVVIDFNGNGSIASASGAPSPSTGIPADIRNLSSAAGIPARVIVYTSATDVTAIDVPAAAVGTRRDDYADVISVQ